MTENPEVNTARIPEEVSTEVRRLMHDLSNALEIVLQAGYLLTTAEIPQPASDWVGMLDTGAQQALGVHRQLREYIRMHS